MTAPDLPARAFGAARRRLARRAGGRRGRGAVLLYHSVTGGGDPWNMTVAPERFEEHMALLSAEFRPLPLPELARGTRRGGLPPGAVGVSFDDGYADNLTAALPRLDAAGVPATVFVATGFVLGRHPFWWDELRTMLAAETRVAEVALRAGDRELRVPTSTEADRARALAQLQLAFQALPGEHVEERLAELRSQLGMAERPAVDRRPLEPAELERLAAADGIEIGAHTRHHSNLSRMPREVVERELADGRADLAELLGDAPAIFSYPFGAHGPAVRRAVRRAGFDLAFGTAPAPITWLSDRVELGRLWVRDVGAGELEAGLRSLVE